MHRTSTPVIYEVVGPNLHLEDGVAIKEWAVSQFDSGKTQLILDFSKIELFDSTFIGILHVLHAESTLKGGNVALSGINNRMSRALKMFNMANTFQTFESTEEAIQSMGAKDSS